MKDISIILGFTIKDWLIAITLFILILCILEIRRLKKTITQEIRKRLIPQLLLEFIIDLDTDNTGFYLKNESFFLAKDIRIEDAESTLDDYGFKQSIFLRFESVESLKAKEKIKLKFNVLDRNHESLPGVTERIFPHLISPSFKVKVFYSNIENLKFYVVFSKRGRKIYLEKIESCQ